MSAPVPGQSQTSLLKLGDVGEAVRLVQDKLQFLGFDPGIIDGIYGNDTSNAVRAFQSASGMPPTGFIDHATLHALGYEVDGQTAPPKKNAAQSAGKVSGIEAVAQKMFPDAPQANVRKYLPVVVSALNRYGIGDPVMLLVALATIRAESAGFAPISEFISPFNTSPGGRPFDLYDFREDLGNHAVGDGDRYKGRGFIQLTGRFNYEKFSRELNLGDLLIEQPDKANDPEIAADLLACFLKSKESVIRQAIARNDFATARKAVNGGSHGLMQFKTAYEAGESRIGIA